MNAVELHCAVVLPAVDGHGRACGVERTGEELADLVCCGDGCDGDRAEAIHGRLHDDGADGGDGILQAHRHADGKQPRDMCAARPQLTGAKTQNGIALSHDGQTQQAGDGLRDHGRPCRALHAHAEHGDGQQVERNVQQGGENEKIDRGPGVSERADDAGDEIIKDDGGDAEENDEDVVVGIPENIVRRVHPAQHGCAQQRRGHGEHHGERSREPDAVCHKAAQLRFVALAEFLRHGDDETVADADAEAEHQKIDGARRADARKRVHAEKTADDERIYHII